MTTEPLSPLPASLLAVRGEPRLPARGNIAARIGNTPLLRLCRITKDLPRGVELWAKAAQFNPGGSVRDRTALFLVQAGLQDGRLRSDKVLLDASSGNTGIAYAFLGAIWGFPVEIV